MATITDRAIELSNPGDTPFDGNASDYDILLQAVLAAGLDGALASPGALTVFAPNDAAFISLAQTLGFDGDSNDDGGAFGYIVDALTLLGGGNPIPLLTDILLYHVSDIGAVDSGTVLGATDGGAELDVPTLLAGADPLVLTQQEDQSGDPISVTLTDADTGVSDPKLNFAALDIDASNGIIHGLDGVLLPLPVSSILTAPGTDLEIGGNGSENFFTRGGDDFIDGNGGNDRIFAGSGSDVAFGGTGNDFVMGNRGNDLLDGNEGRDKVLGGGGNDSISGGSGTDYLWGNWGRDVFVAKEGMDKDVVMDFRFTRDKIDVSDFGITEFDDLMIGRRGIDFGDGDGMSFGGFFGFATARRLDEDDFIFADADMGEMIA